MSWSLGEIGALTQKAGRGAGLDWGVAEELAWAVRWLSARGLPGAESAATLLTGGGGQSALTLGLTLSDTGQSGAGMAFRVVRAPLLLAPFAARALAAGQGLRIAADSMVLTLGEGRATLDGTPPDVAPVQIAPSRPFAANTPIGHRAGTVDPWSLARLQALAAFIYAPATEQSRLSGAGAGLSDNT